jgi:hypothetical protein
MTIPEAPQTLCLTCGWHEGDRVQMKSHYVKIDGSMLGVVHGVVKAWPGEGHCHIAEWNESRSATRLPNVNVEKDVGAS